VALLAEVDLKAGVLAASWALKLFDTVSVQSLAIGSSGNEPSLFMLVA
jgi:hypothetical protein